MPFTPSLDYDPLSLVAHWAVEQASTVEPDAIFIPTRRRPRYVYQLLDNISTYRGEVFVIGTDADDAPRTMAESGNASLIKVPEWFLRRWQNLRTPNYRFSSIDWDLPIKRSYAVWYALERGYRKICLLDDDIRNLSATDWRSATKALDSNRIAGLLTRDFPDTSVVGHASLQAGMTIPTFLSGNCVFVVVDRDQSFFPPVYNEDWLFAITPLLAHGVCWTGIVSQVPYDPFESPDLAAFQEFGEVIAEGLYCLLCNRSYSKRYRLKFWKDILTLRSELLGDLRIRVEGKSLASVSAAQLRCSEIDAMTCVGFIESWESDVEKWSHWLRTLST